MWTDERTNPNYRKALLLLISACFTRLLQFTIRFLTLRSYFNAVWYMEDYYVFVKQYTIYLKYLYF